MLVLGTKQKIYEVMKTLMKHFKLTQSGLTDTVGLLGCVISRTAEDTFTVSQETYIGKFRIKQLTKKRHTYTPLPLQSNSALKKSVDSPPV